MLMSIVKMTDLDIFCVSDGYVPGFGVGYIVLYTYLQQDLPCKGS